ncbi:18432_t:CDS:2, partial [Entrophospora sp. SA101]
FEYAQGESSTTTNGMNGLNQLNYDEILDEKGEKKITKDGGLLGGRNFKVPVFQLPSDNTWYMLSMDAAKVLGFRDSYLFFLRNPSLQRVFATEDEREFLIKIGILPAAYRSRNITLVSARSTYRLFGSRIIQNGKRRKDDYFESNLRYDDDLSDKGNDSETENANNILSKKFNSKITKPRNLANETSWMYQSALHARDYNTRLKIHRKDKPKFYDAHTNIEQVPQATQPTRIKVETISKPIFFLPLNRRNQSPKIPEIKFEPTFFNPLKSLSPEVSEVVPPEIRKIIDDMNKNIKDDDFMDIDYEEDKYPIALMDHQFQSSYP